MKSSKERLLLLAFMACTATWLLWTGFAGQPAVSQPSTAAAGVRMWEEEKVIPTYLIGDPEPNPMFYFGRGSQGAQGRVYPYPLYDNLTQKKADKKYQFVFLENEFVRISILPELGGRLFEGLDKTDNYHFIYRQQVIKPALIGLIGAWISGGIEWNIPHHHRATTVLPVQHRLEENADGSKTIWVGELEVRSRMRWAVGYTLRPGKAYLEAKIRILNRTPVVETMLCFANVAVQVNENYQVLFPPGTQFGTFHSKNQFTRWPISRERYNGADFTQAVDVSWYKNHLSSNSIFAWNYEDDFFGGYDHGKKAGIVSYADHHAVPGKKMWTWGNGPNGRQWDARLTDDDGPYVELMVGAYSDNQPDYTWLQPYEVKSFSMYWYPFREIDGLKQANLDAAVNLEMAGGNAKVGFYATAAHPEAIVTLKAGARTLLEETTAIGPAKAYVKLVPVPAGVNEQDLRVSLTVKGKELLSYSPIQLKETPMPKAVSPPPPPDQIKTNEELYLAGQRIEQFHNPSLDPLAYWQEALRRDPGDARVNTALGIRCLKAARFAESEQFLRKALERLTDRYTTPKEAEATYYLGLTLKAEGKYDEAYETLLKSAWNMAWKAPAYFAAAEIASRRGDLPAAIDLVEHSLENNALNVRALTLKAALLRNQGRTREALQLIADARRISDPLDVRVMAEQWLAGGNPADARLMAAAMNAHPHTACETAAEYLNAGMWKEGSSVLAQAISEAPDRDRISPMWYYYLAYFAGRMAQPQKAAEYHALAQKMPPDYVFPFQHEAIPVLEQAMAVNPRDPRAPYYLGNLLYDWQPAEAQKHWERAAMLDPAFAIVRRNLAVAYSRLGQTEKAIAELERAVAAERKYPLHFAELDALYESTAVAPEKRLALLEQHHGVVVQRDDSLAREISLKVTTGRYDEAITLLSGRRFAVWEGANLNVAEDWMNAHLLRGRQQLAAGRYREALTDFLAAGRIPDNLPAGGRGSVDPSAAIAYFSGLAHEGLGDAGQATQAWTGIANPGDGSSGGSRGQRDSVGGGVQSYYRALALQKLGRRDEAGTLLQNLVRNAAQTLQNPAPEPAPAARNPQDARRSRLFLAHYAAALGYLGLGEKERAAQELKAALAIQPAHADARFVLESLSR